MDFGGVLKDLRQIVQSCSAHLMHLGHTPHRSDFRKVTAGFVVSGNERVVCASVGGNRAASTSA